MMQLLAYSDQRYKRITKKLWDSVASGGLLITSPPEEEPNIPTLWLTGYDAIYIDLHADVGIDVLYGDDTRALSLATVRGSWVDGAVVFLTSCYLPETDFIDAFLDAGAKAVIGGSGENWGGRIWAQGAQLLGRYFLELYAKKLPVEFCLKCAKHRLRWNLWQRVRYAKASLDALDFQIWRKKKWVDT